MKRVKHETHVVDDPKSKCDCCECWYMRGFYGALARMEAAGATVPNVLPTVKPGAMERLAERFGRASRAGEAATRRRRHGRT